MIEKCFGIAGWKNSGKTTLVANLVTEFTERGLVVSTIKHAHHAFDLDTPDTDSFKHRASGAQEVVLVSQNRWAIQHELREQEEPGFAEMVSKLSPCDIVLVEGYKREPIPKIEIIGELDAQTRFLWKEDDMVKAIACDVEIAACALPRFSRNEVARIADGILEILKVLPK